MSIDRTTILKGPGFISFGAASIHSEGDITVTRVDEWSDAVTAGFGRIGRKLKDRRIEIEATPSMYQDLSVLFPHSTKQPGDVLFGGTDATLVITPRNGRTLTILNAVITGLPGLRLNAAPPLFKSPIKWTGLVVNSGGAGTLTDFYTQGGSVGSNVAQTGFVAASVMAGRFTGTRNSVTLRTEKGFEIDFPMQLEADQPDGEPTINYRLKSLEAVCKCSPMGLTESAYLSLINEADGVDIGGAITGYDLVIAGESSGKPSVTLKNTLLVPGGFNYGEKFRLGDLTFETVRQISSNALAALWTISTVS